MEDAYNLKPYSSVIYTPGPIRPVFGVPIQPEQILFCKCGKGFTTIETLRPHQTRVGDRECPFREKNPGYHKGYGQRLTSNRPFFEIFPTDWRLTSDSLSQYPLLFSRSLPPLRDYSKMEIKGAEDEMNTSSFFYSQRWLDHLEGFNPEDVIEVTRQSSEQAPYGERLRGIAEKFLMQINSEIKNHNSFGILKLMGQTTEYVISFFDLIKKYFILFFRRETLHRFDFVTAKTVKKYALTLHRLLFGVIRQLDDSWSHSYRYPTLHSTQLVSLRALKAALINQKSEAELINLFQLACFTLFAHHQHKYETSQDLNQFFSPVICFLVLVSVREKGGFHFPSVITQYIAHIMYAIRAVMFFEVIKKAKAEKSSLSE